MKNEIRLVFVNMWVLGVVAENIYSFATPRHVCDAISSFFKTDCKVICPRFGGSMTICFFVKASSSIELERITSIEDDFNNLIMELDSKHEALVE